MIILNIICFISLIISIFLFYITNKIKIHKDIQQIEYSDNLKKQIHDLELNRNNLINSQIKKREQQHINFIEYQKYLNEQKQKLNKKLIKEQTDKKEEIDKYLNNYQETVNYKIKQIEEESSKEIENIHLDLQKIRESAKKEKQQIQNDINKLKASLAAGVQARLREQEKKDKINFYKLSINDIDLADVKKLENLKLSLHKPVILSKLIWTQYFQKQMTELCNKILGKKTVCGIYKITNLNTEECYIGQSVNIADRWKQHCKCGLGIDASTTNKLYNAMQKDGVWNFTFELLEECPKELLNEKEKFWIQMYQSNKFGYNIMKGIK